MSVSPKRDAIQALDTAIDTASPAVALVRIDGLPRAGLSPKEFGALFGLPYKQVLLLIECGEIAVLPRASQKRHVIPTSELVRWQREATRVDRTA